MSNINKKYDVNYENWKHDITINVKGINGRKIKIIEDQIIEAFKIIDKEFGGI